jgi:hypothetical protein
MKMRGTGKLTNEIGRRWDDECRIFRKVVMSRGIFFIGMADLIFKHLDYRLLERICMVEARFNFRGRRLE